MIHDSTTVIDRGEPGQDEPACMVSSLMGRVTLAGEAPRLVMSAGRARAVAAALLRHAELAERDAKRAAIHEWVRASGKLEVALREERKV